MGRTLARRQPIKDRKMTDIQEDVRKTAASIRSNIDMLVRPDGMYATGLSGEADEIIGFAIQSERERWKSAVEMVLDWWHEWHDAPSEPEEAEMIRILQALVDGEA
jgi:hypothetical protein